MEAVEVAAAVAAAVAAMRRPQRPTRLKDLPSAASTRFRCPRRPTPTRVFFIHAGASPHRATTYLLDLDTGSTDTGTAGHDCGSQCAGLSPLYTPGADAADQHGQVSAQYADNSGWSGEVYSDKMTLGAGSPSFTADIIDIQMQSMFFLFSGTNEYQGILGVGRDDLAGSADTTTYLDGLFKAGVTQAIGVEMCPTDGTFWLGGFDPGHAGSDMLFHPARQHRHGPRRTALATTRSTCRR